MERLSSSDVSAQVPPNPSTVVVRTCVGCRTKADRSGLVRVVARTADGPGVRLVVDERAVLPGRGAWVHPAPECVERALQRASFTRALRVSATADTLALREWFGLHDTETSPDASAEFSNRRRV